MTDSPQTTPSPPSPTGPGETVEDDSKSHVGHDKEARPRGLYCRKCEEYIQQ